MRNLINQEMYQGIKHDRKLNYGKLYRNLINKNPPDVLRSRILEELRQKAFDDFKKKEPGSPRKAVYNLLPNNYHNKGRNNTVDHGTGRLLVNRVATVSI